ncbi:MAG: hypothetical protein ACKVXR_04100 [Planctomycetota bacterium]
MTAPPLCGMRLGLAVLGLSIAASGCCVAPPKAGDLLAVGFRTPEQAFRTFQTAVRADDPGALRRCLSAGFIAEHRLSEQVFREFWDRLEKDEPFLRRGIADAQIEGPVEVRRDLARLHATSHGRRIHVTFVREDFCEAWEGGTRRIDEAASFQDRSGVQTTPEGMRWMFGRMPVPEGVSTDRISELRIGREWKIDGFEILE